MEKNRPLIDNEYNGVYNVDILINGDNEQISLNIIPHSRMFNKSVHSKHFHVQ